MMIGTCGLVLTIILSIQAESDINVDLPSRIILGKSKVVHQTLTIEVVNVAHL